MKLVLFADHEVGACLVEKLADDYRNLVEILAVVTTEENDKRWWPPIRPITEKFGLRLLCYPTDQAMIETLSEADFFLLLSWKHIMPVSVCAAPKQGTINLHYSLLPRYRGVYPVNRAIEMGERETGISFHWVTPDIDAGDILLQARLPILPTDTARDLQLRLDELTCNQLPALLGLLQQNKPPALPQTGTSSYYSREDFMQTNQLDLDATMKVGDMINLLRSRSFPNAPLLHYIDPVTGKNIYLRLALESEDTV